ncbi:hypothetical protein [Massilia antarctica]|uniref:hypothetical protein n=1 Tax=Massilia antarctica TaxID=2765360 RepID=UPI00197DC232|nr:hypothetical protein [Massilia antarctica]
MNWNDLERHCSTARLGRYRSSCAGDERKAVSAYVNNMLLAGAMTPMLSVLEIALRNGIHRRMSALYERPDWWEAWSGAPVFARQIDEVMVAKGRLQRRAEIATPDKIVAELAFGFWSSLFNGAFTAVLWKDLRLVFSPLPESAAQAAGHLVSAESDARFAQSHIPPRTTDLVAPRPARPARQWDASDRLDRSSTGAMAGGFRSFACHLGHLPAALAPPGPGRRRRSCAARHAPSFSSRYP